MLLLLAISVNLLTPQVCTAVATGMAGCAGMILRRELTPLRTAPIILWTLTPQVSSEPQEFTSHDLVFLKEVGPWNINYFQDELFTKSNGTRIQWREWAGGYNSLLICITSLFLAEKATKYCGEDGQWFRHPDTNRTWSNYTLCNENTTAKLKVIYFWLK